MPDQASPPRSLLDRIFSIEGLLGLLGVCLLVMGIAAGEVIAIFWGALALLGLVALYFVRKKDWKAHWEEMERIHAQRGGEQRDLKSDDEK